MKKKEVIFNIEDFVNFYKAGFKDGHFTATGKVEKWAKIKNKCAKMWKARFLKKNG